MNQDEMLLNANIFDLINFKGTDEEKIALLGKLTTILEARLGIKIAENLKPEDCNELLNLMEEMDAEKISAFINAKLPNAEKIFADEIVQFKKDYVKKVLEMKFKKANKKRGSL